MASRTPPPTSRSHPPSGTDPEASSRAFDRRSIAVPIFTASSALVGVCLTVISIVRTFPNAAMVGPWLDDLLAVDAMCFLFSCAFAYGVLRSRNPVHVRRLEAVADYSFLIALGVMVMACATLVWELT